MGLGVRVQITRKGGALVIVESSDLYPVMVEPLNTAPDKLFLFVSVIS